MSTASTAPRPILCVNANAAIDKTITVENFTLDKIHRPLAVTPTPGGKGCNVARVLKTLGEAPIVTGWVGGYTGRYIESGLRAEGIGTAFAHTRCESRTCLSIFDPVNHTLTEIYEYGEPVSRAAQRAFYNRYRALLGACVLVTISGSLPAEVPEDFYRDLITWAHHADVPVLLDSSREPLRLGLEADHAGEPDRSSCARCSADLRSQDEIVEAARISPVARPAWSWFRARKVPWRPEAKTPGSRGRRSCLRRAVGSVTPCWQAWHSASPTTSR
jgi:tagatose 6-phosphate kinase